jgi:hypothetical protein
LEVEHMSEQNLGPRVDVKPSNTAAAPAPSSSPAAAAAASSVPTPPAHPSLISRLSSFLHKVAEFIERHPAATLELGKLLVEVQSMGLHPDELAQLQDIVTVATVTAPASTPLEG